MYDNVFVPDQPWQDKRGGHHEEQLVPQSPLGTVWTLAPVTPKKNRTPAKQQQNMKAVASGKELQNLKTQAENKY
jgi:hypothetical protein